MTFERTTINSSELKKFTNIANEWWDKNGKFAALHKINPIRIKYIVGKIDEYFKDKKKDQIKILDVGCGGGIASVPLSHLGYDVTGIDAGKENIDVAQHYATNKELNIKFIDGSAEDHKKNGIKYDVIICLELIEHVDNIDLLIESIYKMLNKNGIIIISTINRTLKAKLLAVWIAENILRMVPKNTHDFNKFVKPSELANYFDKSGYKLKELKGIEYSIFERKWILSDNIDVNYLCLIA